MTTQPDPSFLNYKNNVRPALFDRNGQRAAQASLEKQRENYKQDTAPKTPSGKQKAHDATVLQGYKDQLRAARRNPLGVNPARVLHYQDLIDQLETKMSNDKKQASFEVSKSYTLALEHANAVRALALDDTEAQNLVNLAFEALAEHKDISRFQSEIAIVAIEAETREQQRVCDTNIASIEANMKQAKIDRDNARLALDNHNKIESAKGNNNE
jgi:flagellar biosynthesis chaperone FliJ